MIRRLVIALIAIALACSVALPWTLVPMGMTKLIWLAASSLSWAGLTWLNWNHLKIRASLLVLPSIVAIPFLLPGRDIDPTELRSNYVQRLEGFEGAKYVWGGESRRGLDCSGLPRRAYRDALFWYGLKHANGRATRLFAEHWWFDASARALGSGYRDTTVAVDASGTLRTLDCKELRAGDLAVTTNGVHVLAYLGGDRWINADPGAGAVVIFNSRTGSSGWLRSQVTAHRWRELQER